MTTKTPCQELPLVELDKLFFTTSRRAAAAIESNCDNCPAEAKAKCGSIATELETVGVKPFGVFGGRFYA
jgi:hypothetical protein